MSDNEQEINDNNEAGFDEMEHPIGGDNQNNNEEGEEDEWNEEDNRKWLADHPNVIIDGVDYGLRAEMKEIRVREGVTHLTKDALFLTKALTSVILPNSITSLGDYAFSRSGILSIVLPDSITSLGRYVFCECAQLESVTLSNSITTLEDDTFRESGLRSIVLPDSLRLIAKYLLGRRQEVGGGRQNRNFELGIPQILPDVTRRNRLR